MRNSHTRLIVADDSRKGSTPRPCGRRWLVRNGLIAVAAIASGWVRADSVFDVDTFADLIDDDTTDGVCHTIAGTCSLRAAIMQSNHPAIGTTTIHLPAGLYLITLPPDSVDDETVGNFDLNQSVGVNHTFIVGVGPDETIVDGNGLDNVFRISRPRTVTIEGMTLRNGATSNVGGGIENEGDLSVLRCVIEHNSALLGGGIYAGTNSGGNLSVIDTIVRSNTAAHGGGIYTKMQTAIRNSELDRNFASGFAGGIFEAYQLTMTNTTISNNAANTDGGGIYSVTAASIYSSTIVDNDADHDRDELGGIGGGILVETGSRFISVNTLFARNTIRDAPISDNCNGTLEVYGMNLLDDVVGCAFTGNGTVATGVISPSTVGPLQDNGGLTPTHALLDGSEAIDATTDQGCIDENLAPLTTDQRGEPRVAGERCDVGAYESQPINDSIFTDGFE